ncbi:MAG: P-loop NTPase [Candidatus Rokubacteria bacterium]|nr:P-loop NTPase [Candidatus Rokubacteria bacterium]
MKRYGDIRGDGGSNIVGQVEAQQARLASRLDAVRFVVAVVSGKGGVGKSALTANLAAALARDGWRVGALDADLNGPSLAKMLGVRGAKLGVGADGIEPPVASCGVRVMSMDLLLPSDDAPLAWQAPTAAESQTWRGSMEANALREFLTDTRWGELDALLLDLPPGTDRLAVIAALLPRLDGALAVTIASDVAQLVVRRSLTAARDARAPLLGLVENMAGLFPGADVAQMAEAAGVPFLGRIPFDADLAGAADAGTPFVITAPERPAARALTDLASSVRQSLETARR